MDPLLVIGAGGHAVACIDVIEQERRFAIAGLIGLPAELGKQVLGYRVLGTDEHLASLLSQHRRAFIAVGQIKTADVRMRLFDRVMAMGCEMPIIVSPRAYVSPHAKVGAGTIVMHAAVINAGAVIGQNCIVNNQALVEHDAVIGDHCHIATAAVVNGDVRIGSGTFIGSQACIRQSLQVGARCVIGMGQRIVRDCADGAHFPAPKAHV